MKNTLKTIVWPTGVMILTLACFTNCSPYSQNDGTQTSLLANLTCDADCITPTTDNLSIKANVTGNQYLVPANLRDFNIAGDCNEGGFSTNTITWDLLLDGVVVRTSNQMGSTTSCANGRFSLYVLLTSASGDPVDRTGLASPSGRRNYQLRATLYGQTTAGGYQVGGNNTFTITLAAVL